MAEVRTQTKTPKRKSQSVKTPESSPVPVGYEAVSNACDEETQCPTLEDVKHGDKEIWLLKVPFNFDSTMLSGQTVVLNGVQDLVSTESQNNKKYEMISRPLPSSPDSSFKVLLPSARQESLWSARNSDGQMSVIQSHHVPVVDLSPCSTPTKHQTPDIKCRWKPFGCGEPDYATANGVTSQLSEETRSETTKHSTTVSPRSPTELQRAPLKEKKAKKKESTTNPDVKQELRTPSKTQEMKDKHKKSKSRTDGTRSNQNSVSRNVKIEPLSSDDEESPYSANEGSRNVRERQEAPQKSPSTSKKHSKHKTPSERKNGKHVKVKLEKMSEDEAPVGKKKRKK